MDLEEKKDEISTPFLEDEAVYECSGDSEVNVVGGIPRKGGDSFGSEIDLELEQIFEQELVQTGSVSGASGGEHRQYRSLSVDCSPRIISSVESDLLMKELQDLRKQVTQQKLELQKMNEIKLALSLQLRMSQDDLLTLTQIQKEKEEEKNQEIKWKSEQISFLERELNENCAVVIASLEKKIAEVTEKYEQLKRKLSQCQERVEEVTGERDEFKEESKKYLEKVQCLENLVQTLETQMGSLEGERSEALDKLTASQEVNKEVTGDLECAQIQVVDLQAKVKILEETWRPGSGAGGGHGQVTSADRRTLSPVIFFPTRSSSPVSGTRANWEGVEENYCGVDLLDHSFDGDIEDIASEISAALTLESGSIASISSPFQATSLPQKVVEKFDVATQIKIETADTSAGPDTATETEDETLPLENEMNEWMENEEIRHDHNLEEQTEINVQDKIQETIGKIVKFLFLKELFAFSIICIIIGIARFDKTGCSCAGTRTGTGGALNFFPGGIDFLQKYGHLSHDEPPII